MPNQAPARTFRTASTPGTLTGALLAGKPTPEELRLWPDALRAVAVQAEAGLTEAQALANALGRIGAKTPVRKSASAGASNGTPAPPSNLSWRARYGYHQTIAEITSFFTALQANAEMGIPLDAACVGWVCRNGTAAREHSILRVVQVGVCLSVSERTGAPIAQSLRRAAEHSEESIDALLGRESALAAPRATGRILALLPFIGLGMGELMGTSPVRVLTGSPAGVCAGLLGVALAVAGKHWTASLLRRAEKDSL